MNQSKPQTARTESLIGVLVSQPDKKTGLYNVRWILPGEPPALFPQQVDVTAAMFFHQLWAHLDARITPVLAGGADPQRESDRMKNDSMTGAITELLERCCPDCDGRGEVPHPDWQEWNAAFDKAKRRLKSVKAATEAAGPYPQAPETVSCPACRGEKAVPTEEGGRLLDFLRRNGALFVRPNPVACECVTNGPPANAEPDKV